MANINHSALSDPYLHEPKGASTALPGQIYVADGAGSGDWVENSRAFSGYLTFSTTSTYNFTASTTDVVMNPTFNIGVNNGFTGLSSPNARVRYDGSETIAASITLAFSFKQASGSAREIQLSLFKNGVEVPGSRMVTTAVSGEWKALPIKSELNLSTNDYLEVFIKADASCTINFASGQFVINGIAT